MRRVLFLMCLAASTARADPLRLRANAFASSASPAGVLTLEAGGAAQSYEPLMLRAEAVVWVASSRYPGSEATGDVLVIAVDARDRANRVRGRVGRFVSSLGALRVAHVDGASLRVALPHRLEAEAIGGVPVMPGIATSRSFDWLAGGRIARRLGFAGSVGIAYAQRRDAGQLASEELGIDAGYAPSKRSDIGARFAYDIDTPGIAELAVTASLRDATTRTELYAIHRAASHLLPASSLFSVLGDVPSQRAGTLLTWKAAPRLDVILDLAMRRIVDDDVDVYDVGAELAGRARLRLDARGASMLGGELRRGGVADDAWLGARAFGRFRVSPRMTLATELELVRPEVDRGRGTLWPWALVAASWERGSWTAAVAGEASSSSSYRYRVDVLAQLSRRWDAP